MTVNVHDIPSVEEMTSFIGAGGPSLADMLPNSPYSKEFIGFTIEGQKCTSGQFMIGPEWAHHQRPDLVLTVEEARQRINTGTRYAAWKKPSQL
jgi:hypothetical protein